MHEGKRQSGGVSLRPWNFFEDLAKYPFLFHVEKMIVFRLSFLHRIFFFLAILHEDIRLMNWVILKC